MDTVTSSTPITKIIEILIQKQPKLAAIQQKLPEFFKAAAIVDAADIKEVVEKPNTFAQFLSSFPVGCQRKIELVLTEICKKMKTSREKKIDSLSRGVSPSSLLKELRIGNKKYDFKCHRPPSANPTIPVTLSNHIIAEFVDNFKSIELTKDDIKETTFFINDLSRLDIDSERTRNEIVRGLFSRYIGLDTAPYTIKECYPSNPTTDGSIVIDDIALVANFEIKWEKGEGHGCPYIQNIGYYYKFWTRESVKQIAVSSVCPTFLVEVVGASICVSAAVFTDTVTCSPLTPMLNFLFNVYDRESMIQCARLLKALKVGILDLVDFYKRGVFSIDDQNNLCFPYKKEFTHCVSKKSVKFEYIKQIQDKLVFLARTSDDDIIVKFTQNYSIEVHETLSNSGFAPKLLGYDELAGGWKMIVMEYLGEKCISLFDYIQQTRSDELEIKQKLKLILQVLHEKNLVHGDFRSNNILIDESKNLFVVDFDWGGDCGVVKYPYFLNTLIKWPKGVEDGAIINKKHDLDWLDLMYL